MCSPSAPSTSTAATPKSFGPPEKSTLPVRSSPPACDFSPNPISSRKIAGGAMNSGSGDPL